MTDPFEIYRVEAEELVRDPEKQLAIVREGPPDGLTLRLEFGIAGTRLGLIRRDAAFLAVVRHILADFADPRAKDHSLEN